MGYLDGEVLYEVCNNGGGGLTRRPSNVNGSSYNFSSDKRVSASKKFIKIKQDRC